MRDVMLDLETLGTAPGCIVLSIGAVYFDAETGKLGEEFYMVLNRESCENVGLTVFSETEKWWGEQSEEARTVLKTASEGPLNYSLPSALLFFGKFLRVSNADLEPSDVRVWGNGAGFDQPILTAAYNAVGIKLGWKFYNERCYRTLKNLLPTVAAPERQGVNHNALDDAKYQALHAIRLLRMLRHMDLSRLAQQAMFLEGLPQGINE